MQQDVQVEMILFIELSLHWEYPLLPSVKEHRNSFHTSLICDSGGLEYKSAFRNFTRSRFSAAS